MNTYRRLFASGSVPVDERVSMIGRGGRDRVGLRRWNSNSHTNQTRLANVFVERAILYGTALHVGYPR